MSAERWVATGIPDRVLIGDGHVLIGPNPLVVGENACYFGFGAGTGALYSEHWLHHVRFGNAYQDFSWEDFEEQATLVGDAAWVNGAMRLTRALGNKNGNAWFPLPIRIKGASTFLSWEMYFESSMGGGNRADGMAFILQSTASGLGGGGGGMGYDGIDKSVGVCYDIYRNGWDPNNNHVEINVNGATTTNEALATPDFQLWTNSGPGTKFYNWINYSGMDEVISVYVSQSPTKPSEPLIEHEIDLAPYLLQAAAT